MVLCGWIVVLIVIVIDLVIMLVGSGLVVYKCLEKVGLIVCDIDIWEINEVFVLVVLCYMKDLGIDYEIINVNGGVIVMGYLLGVIGGMLVLIVLDEFEWWNVKWVMVLLCIVGGMGIFMFIECV